MEDSNIENLNKNDSEFNFQVEEPPRLTSFLRIFGTEEGKNFDLQQEKLNQVKILRKLKKTRFERNFLVHLMSDTNSFKTI